MRLALDLALKGLGTTSPNPMVGAVIVRKARLISSGFHRYAGGPHAEIEALKRLKKVPRDAVLYVTMEPCSTQGRTPACTRALMDSGLKKIVIGCPDPNPAHAGRGIKMLKQNGWDVRLGVLREECKNLNPAFNKFIVKGLPLGEAKMAMSLDGKVATRAGVSKWISSEASRHQVQRMRHAADALLIGSGTVRKDNPRLTLRDPSLPKKRRPWVRVIADSNLKLPFSLEVFKPVAGHATWVAARPDAVKKHRLRYAKKGIELLGVKPVAGGISMKDLFTQLGKRGITSVLIEGGPTLLASCLEEKVVDRLALFMAPIVLGGQDALGPVGGKGRDTIQKALSCGKLSVRAVGSDLLIEAQVLRR